MLKYQCLIRAKGRRTEREGNPEIWTVCACVCVEVRGQGKIERMKTKTEKQRRKKKGQVSGSETEIVGEGIKAV